MRRLLAVALSAGLVSCAGCFLAGVPETIAPAKAPVVAQKVPPVMPEHVTPVNGHQVAQALEEEMTREAQSNFLNPR